MLDPETARTVGLIETYFHFSSLTHVCSVCCHLRGDGYQHEDLADAHIRNCDIFPIQKSTSSSFLVFSPVDLFDHHSMTLK